MAQDIVWPRALQKVSEQGKMRFVFYLRDQANSGTGISCEGLITDLPNSHTYYMFL